MNALTPFVFENNSIRIIDADGNPWFVLRDLLDSMGSSTRPADAKSNIIENLGEGVVADYPLQTAGGEQIVTIVAESAATYLVARSNTERGRKLNRFIHVEVLPSIRKTGSYQLPAPTPAPATPLLPEQRAESIISVFARLAAAHNIPMSFALQLAGEEATKVSGLPFDRLLTQADAMNDVPDDDVMLEPTELGERLGFGNGKRAAVAINRLLESSGLQQHTGEGWHPTSTGAELCSTHAWTHGNKSGYNLKWRLSAVKTALNGCLA